MVSVMPYIPIGWAGPPNRSCSRPIIAPVIQPLIGLRRATAKKITTIIGRSMIGSQRIFVGRNAWTKIATKGIRMVASQLNS